MKNFKNCISILLTLVLLISSIPFAVFNASADGSTSYTATIDGEKKTWKFTQPINTLEQLGLVTETSETTGCYLTQDITSSSTLAFHSMTLFLNLNGHSITMTGDPKQTVISIDDGTLNLFDSAGGGKITGGVGTINDKGVSCAGGIAVGKFAEYGGDDKFNMYGGTICGNSTSLNSDSDTNPQSYGGGVMVYTSSSASGTKTFNMYGGEISGNTSAVYGGGVHNQGTFNMYGGTIKDNHAVSGGGVYNNGTFTMKGGTITSNGVDYINTSTGGNGGGVFTESTFNLEGGTISNNTAVNESGGIEVYSTATLKMTGGEITGNSAHYGGGITTGGDTSILGGSITDNKVIGTTGNDGHGGGIEVFKTLVLGGSTQVVNNTYENNNGSKTGKDNIYLLIEGNLNAKIEFSTETTPASDMYAGVGISPQTLPTGENTIQLSNSSTTSYKERIFSDLDDYMITENSNCLYLKLRKSAEECISVSNYNGTYDGKDHSIDVTCVNDYKDATVTFSESADGTYSTTPISFKDYTGETKTVYYKVTMNNELCKSGSGTVNITQRNVTITPKANQSKEYGSSDPKFEYTQTGMVDGEESQLTGELSRSTGENVGSYDFTIGSLQATSNYNISLADSAEKFIITQRNVTITPKANQSKEYGSSDPKFEYTQTGMLSGEESQLTGELSRTAGENVGSYDFTIESLQATSNYDISLASNSEKFIITKRNVTISPKANQSKEYGSSDPKLEYTQTGMLSGEESQLTGELSRTAGENVGSYDFTIGSLQATSNYDISLASNSEKFTITKRNVTITPKANQSKEYGSSDPKFEYTQTGMVDGEESQLTGELSRSAGENVGSYDFTIGSLQATSNYDISLASNSEKFTITKRNVTITPKANQSKEYGSSDPKLEYTQTGMLSGEESQLTGELSRSAGENVGSYDFTIGSLQATSNYDISLASNSEKFTITKRNVTITPKANQSKEYGSSDPKLEYTQSGMLTGEESQLTGELSRSAGENVGSYDFTIGSLQATSNYNISLADSAEKFIIKQRNVTITPKANQSKEYGSSDPKLEYTQSGMVNGEESQLTGELSRSTGENVGSYDFTIGSLQATSNYNISLANSGEKFTIDRCSISKATVTPEVTSCMYAGDAIELETTVTLNGLTLKKGTDYTVSYENNKKVGTASIIVTGIGNYKDTARTTFEIAPLKTTTKNNGKINSGVKIVFVGKKTLKVTWGKLPKAKGYEIYARVCDKAPMFIPIKTVKGSNKRSFSTKQIKGKAISTQKYYKAFVAAYTYVKGRKVYIAKSLPVHLTPTSNCKRTNPKKVVLKKTSIKLKKGASSKISAKIVKMAKKKKLAGHTKTFRYFSTNPSIAKVNKKGKITAKKSGACKIYVVAENGVKSYVSVTVS